MGVARLPSSSISLANSPVPLRSIHSCPAVPPRYRFHRAGSVVLRPITTPRPAGWCAIDRAGPCPSGRGGEPSIGISQISIREGNGCRWSVLTSTAERRLDHPTTEVVPPNHVKRFASPPPGSMTNASSGPSSRLEKASSEPSGASAGNIAEPELAVMRLAWPPVDAVDQRSSSDANTMRSP